MVIHIHSIIFRDSDVIGMYCIVTRFGFFVKSFESHCCLILKIYELHIFLESKNTFMVTFNARLLPQILKVSKSVFYQIWIGKKCFFVTVNIIILSIYVGFATHHLNKLTFLDKQISVHIYFKIYIQVKIFGSTYIF